VEDRALAELELELASSETLGPLLRTAVEGLTKEGAALARVWLLDPEPGAETLRLSASAGRPRAERGADWTRVDGAFHLFRVGTGKVGSAAASAAPVAVRDVQRARHRIARPDWARREGIHGFAAIPLTSRGQVLGVLGVFRRDPLDDAALDALREVGAHLAAGVRRASSLAELELRGEALARENRWLRETLARERARRGGPSPAASGEPLTDAQLRALERENLRLALERSGGRIYGRGGAAEILGLQPTTLASRIRALGLERTKRAH
jgi:GAF domain-containing protein